MTPSGDSRRSRLAYLLHHGSAEMRARAERLDQAPSALGAQVHRRHVDGSVTVERQGKRRVVTVVPEILKMGWGVAA